MKLITLGTSHGDPGMTRFCSAHLLVTAAGDYLFEAGAPVNALFIRKQIPFSRLKGVFVSHTHEDHTGGLPGLVKSLTKRPVPGQHTRFFLPEQCCIDGLKAFMDSTHRPYPETLVSFAEIRQGKIFDDGHLRVTAFLTDHMANEKKSYPCWAFLAECEGKRVVFTGDLRADLHDFPYEAFSKPAVCVMECQHYQAPRAGKILKELPIERFIGVHISEKWNGHAEGFYKALGSPPWPFAFAADGMEFDLTSPPPAKEYIAILADLHLPDLTGTVKEEVLDWALEKISEYPVSHIVSAGDMTAQGTSPAARRLRQKIKRIPGKFFHAPGNAENRTGDKAAERCLKTPCADGQVLVLDSSRAALSPDSRRLLLRLLAEGEKKELLAVSHYPPQLLPEEDRLLLKAAVKGHLISLLVCGHRHHDKRHKWSGIRCESLRGLDPDKASGGPPALVLFSRDHDGCWQRKDLSCPAADPRRWKREQREGLANLLGLSTMNDLWGTLRFAIEEKVPVLEWRWAPLNEEDRQSFEKLYFQWRKICGVSFSIHFPNIRRENGEWTGLDLLKEAVKDALEYRAERITLHVPRISIKEFARGTVAGEIADITAEILHPLADAGIAIGIENLHMRTGEKADEERGYGYTPQEVLAFADMLTGRGVPAGVHLDIGHARNNAPFSQKYNVSDYLTLFADRINGCHLHQVTQDETGKMHNHQALTSAYGKLISLASLFMAYRRNMLQAVPLILEIRQGRGPESYLKLKAFLNKTRQRSLPK